MIRIRKIHTKSVGLDIIGVACRDTDITRCEGRMDFWLYLPKMMPCAIAIKPKQVGSDAELLYTRLQGHRRSKRVFFQKSRSSDAGD